MSLRDLWLEKLTRLEMRFGQRRAKVLVLLAIVAIASLSIRILIATDLHYSALLYVAIPYGVATMIAMTRSYDDERRRLTPFASHSVSALIVFLASSVVLFEGFICVLFFMPIYYMFVYLAFLTNWIGRKYRSRHGKSASLAIPLLVLGLSVEGTTDFASYDRLNTAVATVSTSKSPQQILQNAAAPFELSAGDSWILSLFPAPYAVDAGSLQTGDIHRVHLRYHRWFFTNTHEGVIEIRIDSVTDQQIDASFVRDTSFFSSYVELDSVSIRFDDTAGDMTDVKLAINYERRLDPAWYFQPLQQYAMKEMAKHLIQEILIRE